MIQSSNNVFFFEKKTWSVSSEDGYSIWCRTKPGWGFAHIVNGTLELLWSGVLMTFDWSTITGNCTHTCEPMSSPTAKVFQSRSQEGSKGSAFCFVKLHPSLLLCQKTCAQCTLSFARDLHPTQACWLCFLSSFERVSKRRTRDKSLGDLTANTRWKRMSMNENGGKLQGLVAVVLCRHWSSYKLQRAPGRHQTVGHWATQFRIQRS